MISVQAMILSASSRLLCNPPTTLASASLCGNDKTQVRIGAPVRRQSSAGRLAWSSEFDGATDKAESWTADSDSEAGKQENYFDAYLGDLHIIEEEEEPPGYVPPPPIASEDVAMRDHVEALLYTLKELVPGPMLKSGEEKQRCGAALGLFSEAVEFQDPFFCFRGIESLEKVVTLLAESGAAVELHEIYYESLVSHRFKRWVYCVCTVELVEALEDALHRLGLVGWWNGMQSALRMEGEGDEENLAGKKEDAPVETISLGPRVSNKLATANTALKLSGELKLEMDQNGKVVNVLGTWYSMEDQPAEQLTAARLWLCAILSRPRPGQQNELSSHS